MTNLASRFVIAALLYFPLCGHASIITLTSPLPPGLNPADEYGSLRFSIEPHNAPGHVILDVAPIIPLGREINLTVTVSGTTDLTSVDLTQENQTSGRGQVFFGTTGIDTSTTVTTSGGSNNRAMISVRGAALSAFPNDLDLIASISGMEEARVSVTVLVPEPQSLVLSALGLLSLGLVGWRRRRRT